MLSRLLRFATPQMRPTSKGILGKMKDAIAGKAEAAKNTVENTASRVKDGAVEATEEVSHVVGKGINKVGEEANKAAGKLKSTAHNVREEAEKLGHKAASYVKGDTEKVGDKVKNSVPPFQQDATSVGAGARNTMAKEASSATAGLAGTTAQTTNPPVTKRDKVDYERWAGESPAFHQAPKDAEHGYELTKKFDSKSGEHLVNRPSNHMENNVKRSAERTKENVADIKATLEREHSKVLYNNDVNPQHRADTGDNNQKLNVQNLKPEGKKSTTSSSGTPEGRSILNDYPSDHANVYDAANQSKSSESMKNHGSGYKNTSSTKQETQAMPQSKDSHQAYESTGSKSTGKTASSSESSGMKPTDDWSHTAPGEGSKSKLSGMPSSKKMDTVGSAGDPAFSMGASGADSTGNPAAKQNADREALAQKQQKLSSDSNKSFSSSTATTDPTKSTAKNELNFDASNSRSGKYATSGQESTFSQTERSKQGDGEAPAAWDKERYKQNKESSFDANQYHLKDNKDYSRVNHSFPEKSELKSDPKSTKKAGQDVDRHFSESGLTNGGMKQGSRLNEQFEKDAKDVKDGKNQSSSIWGESKKKQQQQRMISFLSLPRFFSIGKDNSKSGFKEHAPASSGDKKRQQTNSQWKGASQEEVDSHWDEDELLKPKNKQYQNSTASSATCGLKAHGAISMCQRSSCSINGCEELLMEAKNAEGARQEVASIRDRI